MFEDENVIDQGDTISPQFEKSYENLDTDIKYLDMQISSLQKHILGLESTISIIEQTLNNPVNKNNPTFDKAKLYGVLNKTLEILPLYHSNQQRFLDLKFKYRKEQDDLKYKIVRMINLEIEQFSKNSQSNAEVLETLKNFNFNDPNIKAKLFQDIGDINNDPIYEL